MDVLLAGYGFLGGAIGGELEARGHSVRAIRRNPVDEAGELFYRADLARAAPWNGTRQFDVVIFCLAPNERTPGLYHETYVTAQENLLSCCSARQFIFISSTAVYPDAPGLYREQDAAPHSDRAQLLLQAEHMAAHRDGHLVLRLAGLYSADRPIYRPRITLAGDDRLVHFIHRDDAARAVLFSIEHNLTGIFNVHDGHPLWRSEVLHKLGLLNEPLKPGCERRISSEKWQATGFRGHFSDYFAGIAH